MEKGRILIVDDQEEILSSLGGILSDEGYEVLFARDGQEALHIVQTDSPDMVLLDIWIPGIDGMQTLRAIKRIDPGCSVIMMSGHATIETAVKAIKLGAFDYLEKPVNLEDVLHLVARGISMRVESRTQGGANGGGPGKVIGDSSRAQQLQQRLEEAAADPGSVWLVGDEGSGKEFAARIIHSLEGKDRGSLIKVRCSELDSANFNEIMRGRDDGPNRHRPGKLLQASTGTLLLSRIDRLGSDLWSQLGQLLLRFQPTSGNAGSALRPQGRIVSTSVYDPQVLVRDHGFPSELAVALSQRVIRIPSLKERPEDIPVFVDHFLREARDEFDRDIAGIDDEATANLMNYAWPGNVKELKILVEHVVMTAPDPRITINDLLIPREGHGRAPDRHVSEVLQSSTAASAPVLVNKHPVYGGEQAEKDAGVSAAGKSRQVRRQKTLRGRVVMYGQGLHSGVKTGLTLSPLPPGSGILFGHITSEDTVPAVLHNVESTEFSTCLKGNGSSARTIEHLMAVFHVYGLTNVLVKTSGEVPIMDGSALEFCRLVENAEIIGQEEVIEELAITEPLELDLGANGAKSLKVEPSEHFEIEYFLEYPPPVGSMHMVYRCDDPEDFKRNIASARTFGFVKDMRALDAMGLAGGGRLSNVVLIDEEKVVNPPLRFPDEFVRHKILDIVGDFYLLGRPFRGKITARQTGHTENIAMLKLINEKMQLL
jgi:UDP-3-O-acyl N-acetylglucosamine deacetylase